MKHRIISVQHTVLSFSYSVSLFSRHTFLCTSFSFSHTLSLSLSLSPHIHTHKHTHTNIYIYILSVVSLLFLCPPASYYVLSFLLPSFSYLSLFPFCSIQFSFSPLPLIFLTPPSLSLSLSSLFLFLSNILYLSLYISLFIYLSLQPHSFSPLRLSSLCLCLPALSLFSFLRGSECHTHAVFIRLSKSE